jgi:hypothetical protein
MLHEPITAAALTSLVLSTVLFTVGASSSQSVRAQSNNTGSVLGTIANFGDQVVKVEATLRTR